MLFGIKPDVHVYTQYVSTPYTTTDIFTTWLQGYGDADYMRRRKEIAELAYGYD